jgi:hypothetical protein
VLGLGQVEVAWSISPPPGMSAWLPAENSSAGTTPKAEGGFAVSHRLSCHEGAKTPVTCGISSSQSAKEFE